MKQTRKIQKNTKKQQKVQQQKINSDNEVRQFGLLVIIIVIILFVIYIISSLLKGKDYSSIFDNSLDVNEIQYDEILVGTMLKQNEESYYVLVLDSNDPYTDILKDYVSSYLEEEYTIRLYTVDLNNIFNKSAKAEEFDYDSLKFKGNSLVLVENGIIKETEEDSENISKKLIEMTNELQEA
jgi:hypothetical protein